MGQPKGMGTQDPDGELQEVRLALVDVTDSKWLEGLEATQEGSQI